MLKGKKVKAKLVIVLDAFNISIWEAEAGESEFEASLIYKTSTRAARATQRPCIKKQIITIIIYKYN